MNHLDTGRAKYFSRLLALPSAPSNSFTCAGGSRDWNCAAIARTSALVLCNAGKTCAAGRFAARTRSRSPARRRPSERGCAGFWRARASNSERIITIDRRSATRRVPSGAALSPAKGTASICPSATIWSVVESLLMSARGSSAVDRRERSMSRRCGAVSPKAAAASAVNVAAMAAGARGEHGGANSRRVTHPQVRVLGFERVRQLRRAPAKSPARAHRLWVKRPRSPALRAAVARN